MLAAAAEAAGAAYAREDLLTWGADVIRAYPGGMSGTAALARARLDGPGQAAFDVGYRSVAECEAIS
jgi:hypothetical protein